LLGNRVSAAGVSVAKDYHAVPCLDANAAQLNLVWMNLLSNALDAVEGRPNPQLEVRVADHVNLGAASSNGIEVCIADNGAGVDPAHLPRVFEPFFTTKPIGRGTGLGLSIAYGAVKAHGGTIAVDSRPGGGTTVTVWLPAQRPRGVEPAEPEMAGVSPGGAGG
jgi:two-component system, NtrC family, sensor kinase